LAWFDYDRPLDEEMLQDIDGCLNRLARGSIFVVTIDARPRLQKSSFPEIENMTPDEREEFTVKVYNEWFRQYLSNPVTRGTVSSNQVAPLFYEAALERISRTLTAQGQGLHFIQLFNYLYRDGAPMFTVGGMIGTSEDERSRKPSSQS
jgi:hypothetical protein